MQRASRQAGAVAALFCTVACFGGGGGGGGSGPSGVNGLVTFLTDDNLSGEDDDPAVAVDVNGTIHVVWFSDRDGTKDLYYVQSTNVDLDTATVTWTPPLQLTDLDAVSYPPPTQGDNYPAIALDDGGAVNVAWHRWNLANECHIQFLRFDGTPAGLLSATLADVTVGANFDRFPCVVRYAADDLRIYFGSSTRGTPGVNEVFVAHSIDDGQHWAAPVAVPSLDEAGQHTQFPQVLRLAPDHHLVTLARWSVGASGDALDASSDVSYGESTDGETWTVAPVTQDVPDDQNDFTPFVGFDHDGHAQLAWATIAFGDPTADLVRLPASSIAQYPSAAHLVQPSQGLPDHSPRIVPLTVGGRRVFLTMWVRIYDLLHNQVVYRLSSQP